MTDVTLAGEVKVESDSNIEQAIKQFRGEETNEPIRVPKGFAWNPIREFPRNHKCFCGSGIKFKKCHLPKCSPFIEASKVSELKAAIKQILSGTEDIYEQSEVNLRRAADRMGGS